MTGTAKFDLASKSVVASLSQLQKLAGGRVLEAAVVWNSRLRQCVLEASAKPHAAHKLSATCAPAAPATSGSTRHWVACSAYPAPQCARGAAYRHLVLNLQRCSAQQQGVLDCPCGASGLAGPGGIKV